MEKLKLFSIVLGFGRGGGVRFITEDVFYVGEHVGLGFEKFDLSLSRGSRCRT